MRRWGAALMVLLAAFAGAGRAEDPPADAAKQAPSWTARVFGDLAASRDGAWLAGNTADGIQMFAVGGGKTVTLTFPKGEKVGFHCEFTADSKWLVVPGDANFIEAPGIPRDRKQSVFFFSVATPSKRKDVQITLKPEDLDKGVKKYMDPRYRNMKTLEGAVRDVAALTGSRVVLDRSGLDAEVWDAASATKYAAPASIDGRYYCGIAADGAQFVVSSGPAIEVRDVKTNRVTATIRPDEDAKAPLVTATHPRFVRGGVDVVAACEPMAAKSTDAEPAFVLRCWSVADGRKRWETPLGKAKYVSRVDVAERFVAVVLGDTLRLVDAADGSLPDHELQGMGVAAEAPSADGKALWVADQSGLRRVELPPAKPK